jgi:hypothetical protein
MLVERRKLVRRGELRGDFRVRLPALCRVVEEIDVRKEHLEIPDVVGRAADAGLEIRITQ